MFLPRKPLRIGVGDRLLHDLEQVAILAAQIDVANLSRRTARPAIIAPSMTACGSCSKIRRSLQVPGSLSSPLHRTYFGLARLLGHERPLHAGRKARAAASAQIGGLHLSDDAIRAHFEGLSCRLVSVQFDVAIDIVRAHAEASVTIFTSSGCENK